jgi:hypothetical protein
MRKSSPPRSLAPAAGNAPSREYQAHHHVLAPRIDRGAYRPHWTRRSQLARLLEGGAIGRDEFAAGIRLSDWVETLGGGVKTSTWEVPIDHGGGRPGAANERELAAARALQAGATGLGRDWFQVATMAVIDDLPWARIAQALGLSAKTARVRAIEALGMLARWFRQETWDRSAPDSDRRRRRR